MAEQGLIAAFVLLMLIADMFVCDDKRGLEEEEFDMLSKKSAHACTIPASEVANVGLISEHAAWL